MRADEDEFLRAVMPGLDVVHNLARRLTPVRADAEDLVQETYTRAWAAWTRGVRPQRTVPWLATICLNAGRDRLRRRTEVPLSPGHDPVDAVDVEGEALGRVRFAAAQRALWRLPAEQRIAVTLMDLCGFTAAETAAITGAPRGTVLARVHRGHKRLARLMREVERGAPRS